MVEPEIALLKKVAGWHCFGLVGWMAFFVRSSYGLGVVAYGKAAGKTKILLGKRVFGAVETYWKQVVEVEAIKMVDLGIMENAK